MFVWIDLCCYEKLNEINLDGMHLHIQTVPWGIHLNDTIIHSYFYIPPKNWLLELQVKKPKIWVISTDLYLQSIDQRIVI